MKDSQGRIVGASTIARDITERKATEARAQAQLVRLNLLHEITRAVGGREDLSSIYQVVLRSLEEHLRFDFGCICDYDAERQELTVVHVGVGSQKIGLELALTEQAHVPIDANGLSRCVHGQVVYEPDTADITMPFPQKLAAAGLHSLVVAPLLVESKVFGVLVAARQEAHSFSSGECEFLRQLSEHVALAAHQTELHASLQRAYDDLRQTQQAVMQQERLRALGQMASGIAHDINNAISPMALSTEILLENEPQLSPRIRKHLQMIQQATDDVAKTVARMKEFYRQREPQLTLSPIHMNALVQQVADLTRARWNDMPQRQGVMIEMQTEFAPGLPAFMGVENEIREALINLIFNAVDAMPGGGALTVRTRLVEPLLGPLKLRRVLVEVDDNGAGMDEETRRRCLEPFFTTKGERGTGLGLAMVYGVVQRHSADIEIESTPGKGTTVRLSFAVSVGVATDVALPQTTFAVASRLRILVVDDDPLILRVLCETLESDGHEVITANGGESGIELFSAAQRRHKPFSIVITDLGMPRVDGRKVASFVKSASDSTPVILLTGWGQRLIAEGDVPPHIDYVLSKPPKLRDLREALALCLSPAGLEDSQSRTRMDGQA
jgi:signal transduction histidine kinase/ActR/RegA family two-component response regulator